MHFQAASSSSDLSSESSSDDEKYLLQVPVEKMRIVKSYKRVKTQLRSLKKKKKMLLVQEKVMREEKSLLKNLLFRSLETENKGIRSKQTSYIKEETTEYKYDETDLLIQIQREELLSKASHLENISNKIKTEIVSESIKKCNNLSDDENQAQDVQDKDVIQPGMNSVESDRNNIVHNENLNEASSKVTQLNKTVDSSEETKSQIEQNTNQPDNTCIEENKDKPKRQFKTKNGEVIYKMVDTENGYYIKITVPIRSKHRYFLVCKALLKNMKPIIKEFSDFISIELFMYVTRKLLEERITELLIGKEKIRSKQILKLFREKYPEEKDGHYVISNLVAIWRGDFNDPPDPDDPYNKLITERDPQKLVSYEDIWNGKAVWDIVTIIPEEMPEKGHKREKVNSASINTDLYDLCSESATELQVNKEMDSSFEIDQGGDIELKEEITSSNCIQKTDQENQTTNTEVISTLKRPYEAHLEKGENTQLDIDVKRLRSKEVEMPIKCENIAQTNNEVAGVKKQVPSNGEIRDTRDNEIHANPNEVLNEN